MFTRPDRPTQSDLPVYRSGHRVSPLPCFLGTLKLIVNLQTRDHSVACSIYDRERSGSGGHRFIPGSDVPVGHDPYE